jgi:DNA polymerase-4
MKRETKLNCSVGIASSRMVAKVCSDQAKPNGVLWIIPGKEAAFLAPLDVRKIPGVGKVMEKSLNDLGIRKVGDLAKLDDDFLRERFGQWGMALAGKSKGLDAGGWFDSEIGEDIGPKSISHEHTFNSDTWDAGQLESTIARLSEMVGRRLREHQLHARTVQLKLRYSDFTTLTRAHSLHTSTQLDTEIFQTARDLFRQNWNKGAVRLLGVHVSEFNETQGQLDLIDGERNTKWQQALTAADKLRDKFGDGAVGLASGMRGTFRERTHEALPERKEKGGE